MKDETLAPLGIYFGETALLRRWVISSWADLDREPRRFEKGAVVGYVDLAPAVNYLLRKHPALGEVVCYR